MGVSEVSDVRKKRTKKRRKEEEVETEECQGRYTDEATQSWVCRGLGRGTKGGTIKGSLEKNWSY